MENKLNQCPFCGSTEIRMAENCMDNPAYASVHIECKKCHAGSHKWMRSVVEAATWWNGRADELRIRSEVIKEFWEELHAEAAVQFDHRHDLLRPVETYAQSMVVHTMEDGWSAWLLAKSIIDKRKSDHSALEKE